MTKLENLLRSGYHFNDNENLVKFRFILLNTTILTSIVSTLSNMFISTSGIYPMGEIYDRTFSPYLLANILSLILLRIHKGYYVLAANIVIISALSLFLYALIYMTQDEFRLIWFFIVLLVGFVLLGKKYGILLMLLILFSFSIIHLNYDLKLSKFAYFTFYNACIIFTILVSYFLTKIENDAKEFQVLNQQLHCKVHKEVKEREAQEKMLLHQCRLASMGEMIDAIAHQWRQPLMNINAILMNLDRAIETQKRSESYLEGKVSDVIDLTSHMSQTIEDFRLLFRRGKNGSLFALRDPLNAAIKIFNPVGQNITLQTSFDDQISCHGHFNEIVQAILIILNNAKDVLVSRCVPGKEILISTSQNDHGLYITIEDNGGGIKKEDKERIFDPYFTTKERTGGTGLGLYIAKIIIEKNHGGEFSVYNSDKGATFEILLRTDHDIHT